MSGRIAAVAANLNPDGKVTLYVGSASGGVWRSLDGGTTFKPVFDKQPVQSIGAIGVDPSHPNVGWVGTGEAWTRNAVSIGNGIYKSTDRGDTWTHAGLGESRAHRQDHRSPDEWRRCLCVRPGRTLERLRRAQPVQDDRRWRVMAAGSQRRQPVDRLLVDHHGPAEPGAPIRSAVGLPAEGLDLPLRR
jgi:hypothetical protein